MTENEHLVEDWEGPFFDCYDIPFIINYKRGKDGFYERLYHFNDLTLKVGNKIDLRDAFWLGNKEEEIKSLAENEEVPDTEDILFLTAIYFADILGLEGTDKIEYLEQFK